jgi:hypothetical protein
MSRVRFTLLACLIAVLGLTLPVAPAQQGEKKASSRAPAGSQVLRQVYTVRGASAKDLASALTLHFQAEPAFHVGIDTGSNALLLSAPAVSLQEAMAVLHELDRPPHIVHVEVLCLELAGKGRGEAAGESKPLDREALSGNAQAVRARLRDLQQKGVLGSLKTIELTGLAGQSIRTRLSESRPYTTAINVGRGGGLGAMSRSLSYREVGTTVQIKPEVGADGQVTLDLRIEDRRMRTAESGQALGTDDKGTAVPATEFVSSTLESRVRVAPGQIVLVENTTAGSKTGQFQKVTLVGVSTDESGQ